MIDNAAKVVRRNLMRFPVLILVLLCAISNVFGMQTKQLFYIARSKNANIVHYDANILPDGKIDPKKPIVAYWELLALDGHTANLNFLEKTVYGFECKYDKATGAYDLMINAFKKREKTKRMIKVYSENNTVKAEITIDNKPAYLKELYVTVKDSFPLPKVESVEYFGVNIENNAPLYEKIKL